MYTVCIAEDEYYVQKSIEARIRALPLEMDIMGIAADGIEAEEIYYKYKPDLFFVDISMPQCSGLEFIEKIRKADPESRTVFIIVSSFFDYENMRKAINVQVFDYLRKPIVPSEFMDIVERAVRQADACRQEKKPRKKPLVYLDEYLAGCQNRRMNGTMLILQKLQENGDLQNLREQLMELGECSRIGLKNTDTLEILLFENQNISERNVEKLSLQNKECGTAVFYRLFEQEFPEAVLKAAEAKMCCRFFENRSFYAISGKPSFSEIDAIPYMFLKKNMSDADVQIEAIWKEFLMHMDGEYLCQFFKQFVFWLVKKYDEEKLSLPEQLKQDLLLFSMVRFQNLEEIRSYLQQSTIRYFEHVKGKQPAELIDRICEYIQTHYADPLTLNDLAASFYISPSYLSHLFARKKQVAIVKYIGDVRLEKAVEFLKNTELSISDIAERTGYSDGNYFAKAFKKKYGKSPTDYRKIWQNHE